MGRFTFQIWEAMALGALAVLLSGSMTPADPLRAVNMDVTLGCSLWDTLWRKAVISRTNRINSSGGADPLEH